mgnify:CR=1 FL=1
MGASTDQRKPPASKEPVSPPQKNEETRTPVSQTDALVMKNIEFVGSRQYAGRIVARIPNSNSKGDMGYNYV